MTDYNTLGHNHVSLAPRARYQDSNLQHFHSCQRIKRVEELYGVPMLQELYADMHI